jgi:cytochrome c oxidase subunit 4
MPHERMISVQTYVLVGVVLVLLTVLTVGLSFWHLPPLWHIVMGLSIALVKMSLVVLFFMHAAVSPRLIWIVLVVTIFWLGILLVLTLADYFSRGMIPGMFGH